MDFDQERRDERDNLSSDAWIDRAPYRVRGPEEFFSIRYEGSCHCGRIPFQLSREVPLDSSMCHCSKCIILNATPFQWAASFLKEDINFPNGHRGLEWYDPVEKRPARNLPCKVRCAFCHTPIMDEGRRLVLVFPALIRMKTEADKDNFKPQCHIFYESRVIDVPDGLPKWSGLVKSSELIADSPAEMVRVLKITRDAIAGDSPQP